MATAVQLQGLGNGVLFDQYGNALNGHRVNVYTRGTTTQVQVYQDSGLSSPLTQPLISGANGANPGGIPGYVAAEQSIDFYDNDATTNQRQPAEPVAASDVAPLTGVFPGEVSATDFKVTGLTGATSTSRWVGSTSGGAPTSGTWQGTDWIVDALGQMWVYVNGGWQQASVSSGSSPSYVAPATLGATATLNLANGSNPGNTFVDTQTLTANCTYTVTGLTQGCVAQIKFAQNNTGGWLLTISNGTASVAVPVLAGAGQYTNVLVWSENGTDMNVQGANLVGTTYVVTATNGSWPIPPQATQLEVVCVGGGGQGGGGGTNSAAAANSGGGAGGAGTVTTQTVSVGVNTTLDVTVGAGGSAAGGGGAAGGNAGTAGSQGGTTSVTATGISITAYGGSGGAGGPASATTGAQGGTTPNGGGNPQTGTAAVPGAGGASGASPNSGYIGIGYQGSGGGAGGPSNTTNGGAGGGAGAQGAGGTAGTTFTGSANGGNGTAAAANSASGGGGGGGAPSGGTGGNGGAGGSGRVEIRVLAQNQVCQPVPTPGGASGPDIWDGRVASTDDIVYFTNSSPTNSNLVGISPNDAKLTNYGSIQAGMTSPLNNSTANKRVVTLASFGTISARTSRVIRLRNWSTDTNNKNVGQQLHPASSSSSPFNLGIYPNGNWKPYIGFSVGFPSGAAANSFPAGDNAFPTNIQGFFQFWELFGSGFGSPAIAFQIAAGSFVHGGAPTRSDLNGSTNNYMYLQASSGAGGGSIWVDANPLLYDTWYNLVVYVQIASTASPDGGTNGGLVQVYQSTGTSSPTLQTLLPGSSQGGYSGAKWTLLNYPSSQTTALSPTLNSGGGTNYSNMDSYRTITSANEPVTHYLYPVGSGTTFAKVDPSTH